MTEAILTQILDRLTAIETGQSELRGDLMARGRRMADRRTSDDPILTALAAIRDDLDKLTERVDSLLATAHRRKIRGRPVQRGQIGIYRIEAQIEKREEPS